MPRRALLGALGAAAAVWTVGWLGVLADARWALTVENLGFLAVPVAAGAAGLFAWRDPRQGRARRPFLFLALGSLAWAAGQAVWTLYAAVGDEVPFPSFADVGYLAALPFLGAGVLLWPRRKRLWTGSTAFDAMLAAGLAALLSYDFALQPILLEGVHGTTGWVGLAYPVGDLLLATLVAGGLLVDGWAERGRLTVVGAGLVCLAAADTIFALDVVDGALSAAFDATWIFPFAFLAAASLLPRDWPASNRRRIPVSAVPLVISILVGTFAAVHGVEELVEEGLRGVDDIAIAVLLVLVCARALHMARASARYAAQLERTDSELRTAQTTRDRFLVELVNAQEIVARKIADLLHDDVVQQLTALGFRLELEAQRSAQPRLTELACDAGQITASIRRLLVELHPVILDSQGLGPAIDVIAEGLRERGIDVRVSPFPHRLPRELETLAYRLVQEALASVERTAHASTAQVELHVADGVLRVRISDTGSGVAPESSSADALGLHVSRERVELAGGRFLVQALPGRGTDVVFELPIPRDDAAEEAVS
jgi:signal transduction histidine kinase